MIRVLSAGEFSTNQSSDAIAVLVRGGLEFTAAGASLNASLNGALSDSLRSTVFQVKKGNVFTYYSGVKKYPRVLLVAYEEMGHVLQRLREASVASVRTATRHGVRKLTLAFDPASDEEVQAVCEGVRAATYEFKKYMGGDKQKSGLREIRVCHSTPNRAAFRRARILGDAAGLVRDLVNEPPNVLHPIRLAEIAEEVAGKRSLKIRTFDPVALRKISAGSFLSVGMGSDVPCRMIQLSYIPKREPGSHVALVGKGVTFDSGGLSLKSEKGMEHMKADMAGAATVLACMKGVAELKLPIRVTGLMMLTENMPNRVANRPGDVVRAMNGKTIEITNTDAEGRLALADGLTYAQTLSPDCIIDIATLTGAQVVGLGRLAAAVMGNNEELTDQLIRAGRMSGETLWPLPLIEEYRELLRSDCADIKNSSGIPDAGSIVGGLFLSEFVNHPRWAHLDIAGPAWQEREWSIYSRNATGFGVRCLLTFLSEQTQTQSS